MNRHSLLFDSAPPARPLPAALLVVLITSAALLPRPASADEPRAPTPEQIQQWIKDLGDRDFQTRERAQTALVKAGNAAYFALDALPPSDDSEVKVRVERTLKALEDDAVEKLKAAGASLSRYQSVHWKHFVLENPDARDDDLAPLVWLKHLEIVLLEDAPLTDKALDHCRHLTKLRDFSSYRTEMTDAGIAKLAQLRTLERVGLLLPKMTNKGFADLATLPNLRKLAIFDAPIDGKGLVHLRPLKDQIEALGLADTLVSDDDLIHLRDFSVLRSLRLTRTRVTGPGLRHIRDLPRLELLILHGADLNDAAFPHIAKMPKLIRLHISDASVTSENVLVLRESSSLDYIHVSPEEFTEEEVKAIQKEFDARDIEIQTKIKRY